MTTSEAFDRARKLWPGRIVSAIEFGGSRGYQRQIGYCGPDGYHSFYGPTYEDAFRAAEAAGAQA